MMDMSNTVEIFENEEATKLLDYFVAYKKLMSTLEQIKCIAAVNSEIRFSENQPTKKNGLNQINDDSLPPALTMTLEK
jgi:hypothetical protein